MDFELNVISDLCSDKAWYLYMYQFCAEKQSRDSAANTLRWVGFGSVVWKQPEGWKHLMQWKSWSPGGDS